jgi:hypothetical protein
LDQIKALGAAKAASRNTDETRREFRKPLASERHKTLAATKPWLDCDPPMSKATWYRRQKEKK